MTEHAFVGRQAIVDRERCVVAYELLYRRSSASAVADYDDQSMAAVRVIANTFASLGEDVVLGGLLGYFNVTRDVLLSEAVFALPKERVVIELLEQVESDRSVELRCRALREAGYSLALDDFVPGDPRAALLPLVDVVKVELPSVPRRELRRLARSLHAAGVQALAEKVETADEFEASRAAGFDRFQGYFFARPVVLEGALLDPGQATLLRLLQQVGGGAEMREIVDSFKQDAKLGVNLIRLVNTAGRAGRVRLETIEDGVRHLGLQQLARWVSLLLFVQGSGAGARDPLLALAAHRGRLMERIAAMARERGTLSVADEPAFLAGMLSLVDVLLGRPIESLVVELRLGSELAAALVGRTGELGRLLRLVEATESCDVDAIEAELGRLGISLEELQASAHEAYAWLHALQQSLAG